MSTTIILYIIAAVFFGLAGFNIASPSVRWEWLAFMVLTISLIVK